MTHIPLSPSYIPSVTEKIYADVIMKSYKHALGPSYFLIFKTYINTHIRAQGYITSEDLSSADRNRCLEALA